MPTYTFAFAGGPCNQTTRRVTLPGAPPSKTTCKGQAYERYPTDLSVVLYVTPDHAAMLDKYQSIPGQRDAFAAFRTLTGALTKTVPGELRRIDGARRRIRRAVR